VKENAVELYIVLCSKFQGTTAPSIVQEGTSEGDTACLREDISIAIAKVPLRNLCWRERGISGVCVAQKLFRSVVPIVVTPILDLLPPPT
jgi:hypothetical protein